MNPREIALSVLNRFEKTGVYPERSLNSYFHKEYLPFKDKRLAKELVCGTIRWKKKLDYIINHFVMKKRFKTDVRNILRLGVYQIIFLDRIPDYATVNESVKLVRDRRLKNFINGVLRNIVSQKEKLPLPELENSVGSISTYYSFPEWLIEKWLARFGYKDTVELCESSNSKPELSIKVNTFKTTPKRLKQSLKAGGIEVEDGRYLSESLVIKPAIPLYEMELFKEGKFFIQDESATLVALILCPKPEETVVDLCSCPGGKVTHIAELMQNLGTIISVDKNRMRFKELAENVERLGIKIIYPVVSDGRYFSFKHADRVLIDVPCSGLGTLRKRPDLKWNITKKGIEELSDIQYAMLQNVASQIKIGGVIVYSTCTIEFYENEYIVEKFLKNHKNFVLDDISKYIPEEVTEGNYVKTFPHIHGIDGSFAARLIKVR